MGKLDGVYKPKNTTNSGQRTSFLTKLKDNVFSWLLLLAYFFIPISPFALRGVMLMSGLFLAWAFGMGAQRYFAMFLAYRQIEKEIGEPLRPIYRE